MARELLGWAPVVSLDEGLERTIEWCRRRGWAGEEPPTLAEPVRPVA